MEKLLRYRVEERSRRRTICCSQPEKSGDRDPPVSAELLFLNAARHRSGSRVFTTCDLALSHRNSLPRRNTLWMGRLRYQSPPGIRYLQPCLELSAGDSLPVSRPAAFHAE